MPRVIQYPRVDISLNGTEVPEKVLISSIRAIQSYVSDCNFVSGELLAKGRLDELKTNLPMGHVFMSNSSFAPWRSLFIRPRQDLYRDIRDSFNDYYMEQVSDWRRRTGLGVFSVTSPTSKLPPIGDVEVASEVVTPVSQESSSGVPA